MTVESVPSNCDQVQVGYRILEINSIRWTSFQNDEHANAMFDSLTATFTPDDETVGLTSVDDDSWLADDDGEGIVAFETSDLENDFYATSGEEDSDEDGQDYSLPDDEEDSHYASDESSYSVDEEELQRQRGHSGLDSIEEENSDDLMSDDDILRRRGFNGNRSDYLEEQAKLLIAERRAKRRARKAAQVEQEMKAQKTATKELKKRNKHPKQKNLSSEKPKMPKQPMKKARSSPEGPKTLTAETKKKWQQKAPSTQTRSSCWVKKTPNVGSYAGGSGWSKVVSQ